MSKQATSSSPMFPSKYTVPSPAQIYLLHSRMGSEERDNGREEGKMVKRRRVEIQKIEDKQCRMVTFSKRRQGLFKKASELCTLSGANIAIIVFSPAGKPFSCGHPNAKGIIDRYLEEQPQVNVGGDVSGEETEQRGFWWDCVDPTRVNNADELQSMAQAMEEVRAKVLARADELAVASAAEPSESKGDIVPVLVVDQQPPTMADGDDPDVYNGLPPLTNLVEPDELFDGNNALALEYDTTATATAKDGLLTTAGRNGHNGGFDELLNFDSYTPAPWPTWSSMVDAASYL